jgi:hypothetical protein
MSVDHLHTTLYNRRGVVVTDQWLIVYGKRFAVSDLYYLERARGPMSTATRAALLVGVAELMVVAPVAFVFNTLTAWTVAGLDVIAAAGGMAFCGRRWPASFQLWAEYQGRPTLLFSTGDEQEFGQVSRALLRAVERGQS